MNTSEKPPSSDARVDAVKLFAPFWETCDEKKLSYRIARLERALPFCRGRAADIRPHVIEHIDFLKQIRFERFPFDEYCNCTECGGGYEGGILHTPECRFR